MIRGGAQRLRGQVFLAFVLPVAIVGPQLFGQLPEHSNAVLRAQQFIENPALPAHARQSVLLDNECGRVTESQALGCQLVKFQKR
jgi:hypothetical protein